MKTIIVGLGNPSFSDDGVGVMVARHIRSKDMARNTTVVEASISGLDILDIIADYEKAIIIDAVQTQGGEPGTIYRFDLDQLYFSREGSPHNIDLLQSLNLGKKLGLPLPGEIIVFGIEARSIDKPKEGCTSQVESAIPFCIEKIMIELQAEKTVDD